jgi:hypothetical protein
MFIMHDVLDQRPASLETLNCAAGARIPVHPCRHPGAAPLGRYIVYGLEELASGRHYVGLTRRSLDARIASHVRQSRRKGRVRPGGLMAALRLMDALGQAFDASFAVRVLGRADTSEAARELERTWVGLLDCRVPLGLNGMPGGSSVGGMDNAQPLRVTWPEGGVTEFPSIQAAMTDVNRTRAVAGQPPLEASTVYARFAGGWPIAQALGLEARQDPRKVHAPFQIGAATYVTLEAAAASVGLGVATLRSRLHRACRSGCGAVPQIGMDRRDRGPGYLPRLCIPWPGSGEHLTAAAYAARTGVPKATIMHRWHRARAEWREGNTPSPEALRKFLTAPAAGKRAASAAMAELFSTSARREAQHAGTITAQVDVSAT